MSAIELLFLGSGTSAGVPTIGCHCEVCTSPDPHDKRSRPSVLISYGGTRVLVDTTPELRMQCIGNGIDMVEAVVYTHPHADHIMGLDDLRRFNLLSGGPLDVWADARTHAVLGRCFGYAFEAPSPEITVFRPLLIARTIDAGGEAFQIGSLKWTPIRFNHGRSYVLGFRIGRLAYCTDVSGIPEESYALLGGLDVLILGALGHKKHTSHFSLEEAVEAARRIGAKQTFFTHIGHTLAHGKTNRELPDGMQLGYDGLRMTAGSEP